MPEELRQRYAPSEHQLFGKSGTGAEKRAALRQQVAEDMYFLVERFADDAALVKRSSYRSLALIFQQQCAVESGKVTIQAKPGGSCMQNPSDPDATYDGKKGQGYQVQIAETCNPDNEVQLITAALPETAATSDAHAVAPVLAELTAANLKPREMLADTAYGSDPNVQLAAEQGVELVSPVSGPKVDDPYQLNADDFAVDEATGQVERCPAGVVPLASAHDVETGKTTATFSGSACEGCPFRKECPVEPTAAGYRVTFEAKERRLEERRREEATEPFRARYARRSGIESTNSGLKRRLGMGRLRVRGSPSVFGAIVLKIAGWNVLRSAVSSKVRAWVGEKMSAARRGGCLARMGPWWRALVGPMGPAVAWWHDQERSGPRSAPRAAA